jgi:hypothetical protein
LATDDAAPRTRAFRELAEPIAALTRRIVGSRGFPHAALFERWPDIVGVEIARYAVPERIDYPPRRRTLGTLVIRTASPSLAVELQHMAPAIIAAFNLHAGLIAIQAVRLRHGPLPAGAAALPAAGGARRDPEPVANTLPIDEQPLSAIADPELRDALRRLAEALADVPAKP